MFGAHSKAPHSRRIPAALNDDRGSMPLALILVAFMLIFSTMIASTVAYQVANNRNESSARQSAWALDSVLNQSAEDMNATDSNLTGTVSTPPSWTKSADGKYFYRSWTAGVEAAAPYTTAISTAEVKLVANQGATLAAASTAYRAAARYSWDPIQNTWVLIGVFSALPST